MNHDHRKLHLTLRTITITALLGALLPACGAETSTGGPDDTMSDAAPSEKIAELAQRPDIDTTLEKYERIRSEIRERLSTEIGLPEEWRQPRELAEGLCGSPYADVPGAVNVYMANWVNDAEIPEDKWDHAQALFEEVTGSHGFGDLQIVADAPNDHLVKAYDAYDAEISLGTKKATMLSLDTGCHLVAEAHPGKTHDAPA